MIHFPYMHLTRTRNNEKFLPLCLQVNAANYASGGKIYDDESLTARNHTHRKRIGTGQDIRNLTVLTINNYIFVYLERSTKFAQSNYIVKCSLSIIASIFPLLFFYFYDTQRKCSRNDINYISYSIFSTPGELHT